MILSRIILLEITLRFSFEFLRFIMNHLLFVFFIFMISIIFTKKHKFDETDIGNKFNCVRNNHFKKIGTVGLNDFSLK